jgi:nucleotide-binding universal stress UspA family protein
MKKVLLAFDGINFSEGAIEFARQMNQNSPLLLTAVFLPQVDYANLWSYAQGKSGNLFIPLLEDDDAETIQKNIDRFETLCRKYNVEYRVHKDLTDFAIPALKNETRFADLLIIGSQSFYSGTDADFPSESLKDVLHMAECPVVIVPEKFIFPKNNVLTYDGGDDAVYAIKQFAYLFPEFCTNSSLLVYASENPEKQLPDIGNIEELVCRHFPDLSITKLQINAKKYFAAWIADRKAAILVTGSFSRSALSQAFHKSFITDVISEHRLPVFIAHR